MTCGAAAAFPARVARPQLLQLGGLCLALLLLTALGADSVRPLAAARLPPGTLEGLPAVMAPAASGYSYCLLQLGPFAAVTRRGLALGASAAAASFCVLQSAWLLQASTPPEAVAASLRWLLAPAAALGGPRAAAAAERALLSLLLALRFTALVYEEVLASACPWGWRAKEEKGPCRSSVLIQPPFSA